MVFRKDASVSEPAYTRFSQGELQARLEAALASLAECETCPRCCRVNRLIDERAVCKTGRHGVVSSWFPHLGEENCLRGHNGSGTIFFSHCNLRCVFCQNFDISQAKPVLPETTSTGGEIAEMMLRLQSMGCHNVNFVTPEHVVPQVIEAIINAVPRGFRLPVVYNSSGYDSLESLSLLDGLIDIYMPDFKFWSEELSRKYLKARDYPGVARLAIEEMHRQVGDLVIDHRGIAVRGLLIRHLVMPGCVEDTRAILQWIATRLGCGTYVNVMSQYHPAGRVQAGRYPELARPLALSELLEARQAASILGLTRLDR